MKQVLRLLIFCCGMTVAGCGSLSPHEPDSVAIAPKEYSTLKEFIDAVAYVQLAGDRCFFQSGTNSTRLYLRLSPSTQADHDVLAAMGWVGGDLVEVPPMPEAPLLYVANGRACFTIVASAQGNMLFAGRKYSRCTFPAMATEVRRNDVDASKVHKSPMGSPVILVIDRNAEMDFLITVFRTLCQLNQQRHVILVGRQK